jgi:hypothetical protein
MQQRKFVSGSCCAKDKAIGANCCSDPGVVGVVRRKTAALIFPRQESVDAAGLKHTSCRRHGLEQILSRLSTIENLPVG